MLCRFDSGFGHQQNQGFTVIRKAFFVSYGDEWGTGWTLMGNNGNAAFGVISPMVFPLNV